MSDLSTLTSGNGFYSSDVLSAGGQPPETGPEIDVGCTLSFFGRRRGNLQDLTPYLLQSLRAGRRLGTDGQHRCGSGGSLPVAPGSLLPALTLKCHSFSFRGVSVGRL